MKTHKKPIPSSTYNPQIASALIRYGLAAVFIYAGFDAFKEPNAWIAYIPEFSNKFIEAKLALDIISVIQLILAVVLITGRYVKYCALVSIGFLAGLMIFNLDTFLITFRDIGLITASAALIFLDKE